MRSSSQSPRALSLRTLPLRAQRRKRAANKPRRLNVEFLETRRLLDASGLVGYWKFDVSDDLGLDASSSGNNLTPLFGASYDSDGASGGAVALDGVDDVLAFDNAGDDSAPGSFPLGNDTYSISAWVRPANANAVGILGWGVNAANQANTLSLAGSNTVRADWGDNALTTSASSGVNLNDGQWHHVATLYDESGRSLWIDGQLMVSDAPGEAQITADSFRLGGAAGLASFAGELDEIAIFTTVLTSGEVAALASGAPADDVNVPGGSLPLPEAYWTFDTPGNVGLDSGPRGSDLAAFGDSVAYSSSGRFEGALSLGGSQDYLALANGNTEITNAVPAGFPTGNSAYTVSTWIRPTVTGTRGIIGWGNYGNGRQVNAFRLFNSNGFRHYWWGADLDANDVAPQGFDLDDGQWHHALVTFNGSNSRQLWLDGTLLNSDIPGNNNAQPMRFRLGNTNGSENFQGLLDDIAVWSEGLSAQQIQALASGGLRPVAPNARPSTAADSYAISEDQTLTVIAGQGVLANDSDADGDDLIAMVSGGAAHGSVTMNADGSFNYVPKPNYHGNDSFTYRALDGRDSTTGTVTISISSIYDPAVAVADSYVLPSDTSSTINAAQGVLANDLNPDNAAINAIREADVSSGSLDFNNDGSFTYTPNAGFRGADSFTYRIDDSVGLSNEVQVTLRVDSPPDTENDSYNLAEDSQLINAASVLANDSDAQNDPITARLGTPPQHGQVTLRGDGTFDYTPDRDFFGVDVFTYIANDGDQDSAPATVTVNVAAVNDSPLAIGDSYLVVEGQTLTVSAEVGVLSNDIDVDGPTLTANLGVPPTHGLLTLMGDGSFVYTPNVGYAGEDFFTYTVSDSLVESTPAAVRLQVERADRQIVINEIHYEPDDNSQRAEFIELYNNGIATVALDGWRFTAGIDYTFPANTSLAPGEFLLIAENPSVMQSDYGVTALGPWQGSLNNEGEQLVLRNADDDTIDTVDYRLGFPWPIDSAGHGPSMELINPSLDNDLGSSWRPATQDSGQEPTDPVVLLSPGAEWSYRKGTSAPSTPADAWRQPGFVQDATWLTGQTPIGYGDNDDATPLNDMQNTYSTVYLRNQFTVEEMPAALTLRVYVDDGAIVYINGQEVTRLFVSAGEKNFNDTTGLADHERTWEELLITNPASLVNLGVNTIAIHSINATLGSSDLSIDASVIIPGSDALPAVPSPGARNSVYAENAAPNIRQVKHDPQTPVSNEMTKITAKVTDPDGVQEVMLSYQVVAPGAYIPAFLPVPIGQLIADADTPPAPNPAFEDPANWQNLVMVDDGSGGDEVAGDNIYTALAPGQDHRTLVRYRITVTDQKNASARAPFADDPSLNFAYFVYDGVPSYNGASSEVLESLPLYHFITRAEDMTQVLAYNGADQIPQGTLARFTYNWPGTMVYDGKVYDNIKYRLRGANGRYYLAGKRSMRFRFNEGNYFQARDQNGELMPVTWRTLTTGKGFDNRQTQTWALNEAVSLYLYDQIGVPSSDTFWTHFRVIDGAEEAPDQWRGDFWGLNFVLETYDVRFLEAHNLAKGNLYKLINQTRDWQQQQRYQAADAVRDGSDHNNIENNLVGSSTADYIDAHVNLEKYYLYHALAEAIRHYDYWPDANKNMVYYFEPVYLPENNNLGKLWILPWDTDASWGPTWNSGYDVVYNALFPTSGGGSDGNSTPELWPAYFSVVREIRDLLWQPDQINPLVDSFAAILAAFMPLDEARWKNAPADAGNYNGLGGQGAVSLAALAQDMKNFAFSGGNWPGGGVGAGGRAAFLDSLQGSNGEISQIPGTPSIYYDGGAGFPIDGLTFQTSQFSDPQGAGTFAAQEWRVAEITDPNAPGYDPSEPFKLEWNAAWESGELTTFQDSLVIPATAVDVGRTYRARVRVQDSTGRWSHWSAGFQFTTTAPNNADAVRNYLRFTEVMYHPTDPVAGEVGQDADDFEYLELLNTGPVSLDLTGVQINDGIQFDFTNSNVTQLGPSEYELVGRNQAAFEARYGAGLNIAGEFDSGGLANGGESLALTFGGNVPIQEFDYDDEGGWPILADGNGASLEVIDTAGDYTRTGNWRASVEYGGTPGFAGAGQSGDVVINEVLSHTDPPQFDSIELFNRSSAAVDISGWWVSDSAGNLLKYQIPASTTLPVGGYLVLDENDFNASLGADPRDFALDGARGDEVYLLEIDAQGKPVRFSDAVEFGAAANGESSGRFPNGVGPLLPMSQLTLGAANSTPRIGPLLISEIMYNPQVPPQVVDGDQLEYLEIYNPTAQNVGLDNWRLAGGIDFDFPLGSVIAAQSAIVVTPFDPLDPAQAETLATFLAHYGLDAGAPLIGGYSGKLDNGGERVRLQRPDEPPIDDPSYIPRLLEDEADYDDDSPWPTIADGGGPALTRLLPAGWGGDVLSWGADTPSPGAIASGLRVVGIDVNGANADPADRPGAGQPTSWRDQRSDIRSIVINFNDRVDVAAADLRLTNLGVNAPADADVDFDLTENHLSVQGSVVTLRFSAQELPEGVYQLEILPSVTNLQGDMLDGDADGSPGGTFALVGSSENRFYKFHGDFNADRGVTIFDFPSFAYWFGVAIPQAPDYVDLNTDGGITIFDFPVFAARFGQNVTMPNALVTAMPAWSIDVGPPLADAPGDDSPRGDEQSALERVVAEWDNLDLRARPLPNDADPVGDRQDNEREEDLLEALVADVAQHWRAPT